VTKKVVGVFVTFCAAPNEQEVKRLLKIHLQILYRVFFFRLYHGCFNIIAQSAGVNVNATIPERMVAVAIVIANCLKTPLDQTLKATGIKPRH
jgi:hypothetical protein